MSFGARLTADASKCFGGVLTPQVHQDLMHSDIFRMVDLFSLNDLKTMFFLRLTDVYDKESLNSYLKLVAEDDRLKFQFSEIWHAKNFNRGDLIELLGTMKKFKHLRSLGVCQHIFKSQQDMYTNIPEISKFLFTICEDLDDDEVKIVRCDLFPEISKDICGEELICLMLLEEKIRYNDFSQLKQTLGKLKRDDIISKIETYENKRLNSFDDFYPVRQPTFENPSGLALILNQKNFTESELDMRRLSLEERKGSDIDCKKLENLWRGFGFEVEIHVNLPDDAIFALIETLSCRNMSYYDVLVICIMSHGKEGCFYSSNSKLIEINPFIESFANRCMIGKPKLIFIQACQGDKHNEGVPVYPLGRLRNSLVTDSQPQLKILPSYADIFKAVATINGHVSYRDEQDGSLFISHLVKNVDKFGDKEDIDSILTKVKKDISEESAPFNDKLYKQLPISSSTLLRKVVLKRVRGNAV